MVWFSRFARTQVDDGRQIPGDGERYYRRTVMSKLHLAAAVVVLILGGLWGSAVGRTYVVPLSASGGYDAGEYRSFDFDVNEALAEIHEVRLLCEGTVTAGLSYNWEPFSWSFRGYFDSDPGYLSAGTPMVGEATWPSGEWFSADAEFGSHSGATWDFLLDGRGTVEIGMSPVFYTPEFPPVMMPSGDLWSASLVIEATPAYLPTMYYYVDADANGANDGSSWENAYNFLQDALADANSSENPVEIEVAEGVYRPDNSSATPDGTGDRTATFRLINGVSVKGGYAGFGAQEADIRDIELYETVLSGDLNGDDMDEITDPSRDENSFHIVTGSDVDSSAVLDGFTITGGNADDYPTNSNGGGMYSDQGSPTVTNCTFIKNAAVYAGAMAFSDQSNSTVTRCTFTGNHAASGGAVYYWNSQGSLSYCRFNDNVANHGGAVRIYSSTATIANCIFTENQSEGNEGGGGVYVNGSTVLLSACTLSRNTTNGHGGGIFDRGDTSNITLQGCVLWSNRDNDGVDESAQIYDGTMLTANYCCIQGWTGDLGGAGNIGADPFFVDPNEDDYHLQSQAGRWEEATQSWIQDDVTSPCIDAGDPMDPIGHEPFPNGGIANMGAYGGTIEASKSYFDKPPCEIIVAGDVNGDCVIDFRDFQLMVLHWMEGG